MTERKPNGYWKNEKNIIQEAKAFIEEHGEENFSATKMVELGYTSLPQYIGRIFKWAEIKKRLGILESRRPYGYWKEEKNVIKESADFITIHGASNFSKQSMSRLGYSVLANGINDSIGWKDIKTRLKLDEIHLGRKPQGFWKEPDNILNESRSFIRKYGAKNFNVREMRKRGFTALSGAITAQKLWTSIRTELDIKCSKPRGYWEDHRNLIYECEQYLDQFGNHEFEANAIIRNGRKDLASAIGAHCSIIELREELGIDSTFATLKRHNILAKLRQTLENLQFEGVAGLAPSQMLILLQQGGFDELPMAQGGDIFKAIAAGALTPQGLIDWSKTEALSPSISPSTDEQVSGEPSPVSTEEEQKESLNINFEKLSLASDEEQETEITQTFHQDEEETNFSPLALMDPNNQFRFLDGVVFAADDSEAVAALKSITHHQLWAKAYLSSEDEAAVVESARSYESSQPWTAEVQQEFLATYEASKNLSLPSGYNYRVGEELVEPRLMQKHVAVLAKEHRQFLVMSDMGTGKSLAAQLAVKADGAKRILVIPINSCVDQWINDFSHQWTGNRVLRIGRPFLKQLESGSQVSMPENEAVVWVLPAHLLSLMRDEEVAALAQNLEPDAVIADEIHVFKTRESKGESKRRIQTKKLLALIAEQKPNRMVLGLSGTVIVNSLTEGKALLELVTGEERDDLPTGTGLNQAMRMHQALMATGIRQRMENDFTVHIYRPQIDASHLIDEVRLALHHPPRQRPLRLERVLIEARIPQVVKAIGDQPTVIASQYVEGFVGPLRDAITAAGYSVGVHTGQEKFPVAGHNDAIEAFKAGAIQVLIGSIQTICTGIDGLQKVCSNMVIASQPWTSADYQQLMARLARQHQRSSSVTVHIPTTFLEYYDNQENQLMHWSFCEYRQGILDAKKRLMDAVMDGLMPPEALSDMTEAKVGKKLSTWLERLSTDGALVRSIKEIRVPLVFSDASEEKKVRRSYGTFSTANGRWNASNSSNLHQRLQSDPTEWMLYHTDLDEIRKDWTVDPLQEAISILSASNNLVVGDFGCGQAQLAEALSSRHTVHSFDHIAINESVIACDCADQVPLEDGVLDYAVFSLSLMGRNWADQLNEAWRVLKPTGQILIWTANSHLDITSYNEDIESRGFKILESEANFKWQKIWGFKDMSRPPQMKQIIN